MKCDILKICAIQNVSKLLPTRSVGLFHYFFLLSIIFLSGIVLNINNANATSIPTLYNVSYQRQINNGSWGTEQLGTTSLPYSVGGGLYYSTNFKVRNFQGTFNVPSSSVLAYDLRFNFDIFAWNGNSGALSNLCSNIIVDLTPTDGSLVSHNSSVTNCTSNGSTANITVHATGSFNVQTTISTFYWSLSNNDNYFISCSNLSGAMTSVCGTSSNPGYWGFGDNTYYEFTGYDDPSSAFYQEQISQNNTMINQNQQIIEQQEATNDWLTDDTAPSADTSSLGNAAGWLPPGPLDSILNLPIQFIQGVIGVFTNSNTCAPIVLPIGIVDYNLEIPCMRSFFELASVNIVWNTVGTIISAILIFNTLKWLYKFVDDTLSFRENNSTMWGGL